LSVVTLGDIERGIALAEAEGRSMAAQRRFLSGDIPDRFGPRILQFGSDAALIWGRLLAELKRDQEQVRRLAIRRSDRRNSGGRAAFVATRNTRDFERLGFAALVNPFEPST
jgi:toxin FitB